MKKIILIFIIIGIYSLCQAKPWYDYDVYTNPADGDHFLINDISETGPPDNNAAGTLKRLAWLYVQPRDSDLTAIAALTTDPYGRALLAVATELAFQQLVNLEIGVDVQAYHINLDAIADADTVGSTTPGVTMYDNNATGDTGTAFVRGTALDTLDAVVMSLQVEEADGDTQTYIELDGLTETVDVLKPMTAPSVDAGTKYIFDPGATLNIQSTYPNVCELTVIGYNENATYTLPNEVECTTSGSESAKRFCFSMNSAHTITITPGTGDVICIQGTCETASESIDATAVTGSSICMIGMDIFGTDYWEVTAEPIGTWTGE